MKKARDSGSSFMKQAAILVVAGLIVRFLGFLYRLPLTDLIGDEGNAIFAAGYYIYQFLLILSSAGLPAAISKMVSERIALKQYQNAHRVFQVSLLFSAIAGLISMLLLIVFAKPITTLVKSPDSYYTLLTLAPTLFIVAIMSVYRGYFQGMRTMVPTAISQVVEQIFHAVFSVYLAYVLVGKSVALGAAGATAGTGIGALAGLLTAVFAYILVKPSLNKKMIKEKKDAHLENRRVAIESRAKLMKVLLATALPIIIGTAVFSVTNLIDMSMVLSRLADSNAFTPKEAQELYGQLSGKFVVLTTLPVSISSGIATASIPTIASSVIINDRATVKRKLNLTIKVVMLISIPAAMGIGVLGEQIIKLLFPGYPDGGMLLKVGAVSIVFLSLCQIVTGVLQGIGKVHIPVIGALLGAATKIILNYVLIVIPQINVLGAVISTIACYLVAATFNLVMLVKATKVMPNLMDALVKPSFASLLMGIACFSVYHLLYMVFPNNTIVTFVAIIISIGVYGLVMLLIKGISEDEILLLPAGRRLSGILKKYRFI